MIFYLHTPDGPRGSGMCGSDYRPRIGEKIRVDYQGADYHPKEDDSGLYVIEDVLYQVPNNPGRQRIDVYARKVSNLPSNLSYEAWSSAMRFGERRMKGYRGGPPGRPR
jgi:hypothetical protein